MWRVVRVEVTDEEGMTASMETEGDLQSEMLKQRTIRDVLRFLETELSRLSDRSLNDSIEDLTINERLASFLRYDERAPRCWFTSSQIRRMYVELFGENVGLSTISTYLSRMHSEGILERKGSRALRQYRLISASTPDVANAVNESNSLPLPVRNPSSSSTEEYCAENNWWKQDSLHNTIVEAIIKFLNERGYMCRCAKEYMDNPLLILSRSCNNNK
jgi:hypothetical protein